MGEAEVSRTSSARHFCDEQVASGVDPRCVWKRLQTDFGLPKSVSKALLIASPEWHAKNAYECWVDRKNVGISDRPAGAWLERKYKLSVAQVDGLLSEFERGNSAALKELLSPAQIIAVFLTEEAKQELGEHGLLE